MTQKIDNIIDTVVPDKRLSEQREAMLFGREALSPLIFNKMSTRLMQKADQVYVDGDIDNLKNAGSLIIYRRKM